MAAYLFLGIIQLQMIYGKNWRSALKQEQEVDVAQMELQGGATKFLHLS